MNINLNKNPRLQSLDIPYDLLDAWVMALTLRTMMLCLVILGVSHLGEPLAQADEFYTFVLKKQEEKKKTSWSLQDWLETRDRMRLMDMWLAIHSPSPYEFLLDESYDFAKTRAGSDVNGWNTSFAAYASIFGLKAQLSSHESRTLYGFFHLRLLGFHAQGTQLTLEGGMRSLLGSPSTSNSLAGSFLTIYLTRYFGIEGLARHYFGPADSATHPSGERFETGAFINFNFVRVYGDAFWETTPLSNNGLSIGTKVYF